MTWYFGGIVTQKDQFLCLDIAGTTLRNDGFNVFDPAIQSKMDVAGQSNDDLGVLVTVLALSPGTESLTVVAINAFSNRTDPAAATRAQNALIQVYQQITGNPPTPQASNAFVRID